MAPPSLSAALHEFWTAITAGGAKLALLQHAATLRPIHRTARHAHALRREHNRVRLEARWKSRPCFVCCERASQEHHIVTLHHGGTNRRDNKVWVCTPCHRLIHPHMTDAPKTLIAGLVPYMRHTEQPSQCPACHTSVVSVQPAFRKTRYPMAQSRRPILLTADAVPPYVTSHLHQSVCLAKSTLNRFVNADLGRLAKQDIRWAEQHG